MWKSEEVTRLETFGKRLFLRTHHPDDTSALASIFSSPFSRRYLQILRPPSGWKNDERIWTDDDFLERVQMQTENRRQGKSCVLNIILPSKESNEKNDRCIGTTGFVKIENSIGFLGIITDEKTTRKGYGTEALHASIQFAFDQLGVEQIQIQTNELNHQMRNWCENLAEIPLIEKLPMTINEHSFIEYNYRFDYSLWIDSIQQRLETYLQKKIRNSE